MSWTRCLLRYLDIVVRIEFRVSYWGIVTARCVHICYMILSFLYSLERKAVQSINRRVIKKVSIKKIRGYSSIKSIFYIAFIIKKKIYIKDSSSTDHI